MQRNSDHQVSVSGQVQGTKVVLDSSTRNPDYFDYSTFAVFERSHDTVGARAVFVLLYLEEHFIS